MTIVVQLRFRCHLVGSNLRLVRMWVRAVRVYPGGWAMPVSSGTLIVSGTRSCRGVLALGYVPSRFGGSGDASQYLPRHGWRHLLAGTVVLNASHITRLSMAAVAIVADFYFMISAEWLSLVGKASGQTAPCRQAKRWLKARPPTPGGPRGRVGRVLPGAGHVQPDGTSVSLLVGRTRSRRPRV